MTKKLNESKQNKAKQQFNIPYLLQIIKHLQSFCLASISGPKMVINYLLTHILLLVVVWDDKMFPTIKHTPYTTIIVVASISIRMQVFGWWCCVGKSKRSYKLILRCIYSKVFNVGGGSVSGGCMNNQKFSMHGDNDIDNGDVYDETPRNFLAEQ